MIKTFLGFIKESTLKYHSELNKKLWDENMLKDNVREKLLQIASTWAEFSKIPEESINDILMVGGNANYNYTDKSDIDVHLLIDKSKFPECEGLLDEYLKDKKQLWSLVHNIKVMGHDVELYAQDVNEETPSDQGVFSLKNNKWIKEPIKKNVNFDDKLVQDKVEEYKDNIDNLINSNAEDSSFDDLKKKFRNMRASGLKSGGEFSTDNLIFKELRNLGYLEKMTSYIKSNQDKKLSL